MEFKRINAPYSRPSAKVSTLMLQVVTALVPAAIAYVWFFGPGFLINLLIASATCIAAEAGMVHLRKKPAMLALSDFSAIVAAVLLAFALPPLTPWWVTVTASVSAIVLGKHLYGGIGFNVFNPAMVGYVVVLVAFPVQMNFWLPPDIGDMDYPMLSLIESLQYVVTGNLPAAYTFDEISRATPLDAMQAGLGQMRTVDEMRALPLMGDFGGRGWEWIANFIGLGGIWLLYKKVIRWHIPVSVLAGLLIPATILHLIDPGTHAGPGFHLFSGATVLAAFFIATDPVSAAASHKGRIIYGLGIGLLTWLIRAYGAYADGVAFAVLLMNMAVPAIDRMTMTRIVGHRSPRR